jgi:predicted metal-dependent hydrolase
MQATWNGILSTVRFDHPELPWPVALVVHPRARRLRLRLDPERGELRLTCPPRANKRSALAWAVTQRTWVEKQIDALPPPERFTPGQSIPFDGSEVALNWIENAPRTVHFDGAAITTGGPREAFESRIERWLRRQARDILSKETAVAAARASVNVSYVSVGDAGTRWGSCSASGAIRYNWRLVMAPAPVRRWVVAHEVAHRLHMDHSPAFHAAEQRIYEGDCRAARLELRRLGARLKRIGRLG